MRVLLCVFFNLLFNFFFCCFVLFSIFSLLDIINIVSCIFFPLSRIIDLESGLADHGATVFTLSKTFENAPKKISAAFLPIVVMKSGARTIKHIYFVSFDIFLHSSILTYLLIFISSSLS